MARIATTADAFNAVAEPRRRQILDVLAGGERAVNDLVRALGIARPRSRSLRVPREVGAVDVREHGRQRLYRLNGRALNRSTTGSRSTSASGPIDSTSSTACSTSSKREEERDDDDE